MTTLPTPTSAAHAAKPQNYRKWIVLAALEMEAEAISKVVSENLWFRIEVIGPGAKKWSPRILKECAGVILAGVAGGLDPSLQLGEVIVSGVDGPPWPKLSYRRGEIYTSDKIISTPAEKQELFQRTGALAVDMEGEIVKQAAAAAGVPMLMVRGISDTAEETIPPEVLSWVDAYGRVSRGSVAMSLVKNPLLLPVAMRLGKQSKMAMERVADVIAEIAAGL
jgi:adenosylhomocysteine nucleosidase